MRWRKARRNKRRALAHKPRKAPLFTPGWREWLDKMLPELLPLQNQIFEDSVFARLMSPSAPNFRGMQLPTRRGFPISAYGVSPEPRGAGSLNRQEIIWRDIWVSQDHKCAECGQMVQLENTTKRSHSFDVICHKCYESKPPLVMIIDDIDFSESMRPVATKRFIFGDNWNAFQKVGQ